MHEPRRGGPYNCLMLKTLMTAAVVLAMSSLTSAQTAKGAATKPLDKVTVFRTATCGCCGKWVDHMKAAGFDVTVHVVDSIEQAPNRSRVPENLRSCHTGTAGPYALEGHIPADVVKDLLRKRPANVDGIAVPGMPAGSPGMESPNPEPYKIIAFDRKGATSTFAQR